MIRFHPSSNCFYHHLSLLFKNYGFQIFCDLFEIEHTEFFYSCKFDLQYTDVLNDLYRVLSLFKYVVPGITLVGEQKLYFGSVAQSSKSALDTVFSSYLHPSSYSIVYWLLISTAGWMVCRNKHVRGAVVALDEADILKKDTS